MRWRGNEFWCFGVRIYYDIVSEKEKKFTQFLWISNFIQALKIIFPNFHSIPKFSMAVRTLFYNGFEEVIKIWTTSRVMNSTAAPNFSRNSAFHSLVWMVLLTGSILIFARRIYLNTIYSIWSSCNIMLSDCVVFRLVLM